MSPRQFTDFARQVTEVSQINAMNIFLRYQTMASQLTAFGLHIGTPWPYVQMPSFEAQASAAAEATAALFVLIAPVVQTYEVLQYEEFVASNRDWIQEGLEYQGVGTDTNASSLSVAPHIYALELDGQVFDESKALPFHLPVGQISSVHQFYSSLNGDIGTDRGVDVAYSLMNRTRKAVMSGLRSSTNPSSFMATPVFESFADDAPVVAIFSGYLRWSRNFENLLPAGSEPLILVVRNCDDALSYEVRGPNVEFLGFGDTFRDPKYSYLERSGTFTPFASSTGCDFTLHIYPTPEFEAAYRTNAPTTKTVAIMSCFLFTAFLFVLFNLVVEYRQKRLESNATTNSALVSSLFPENVLERLAEEYNGGSSSSRRDDSDGVSPGTAAHVALTRRPPIADRFESCSVFFADLVGCKQDHHACMFERFAYAFLLHLQLPAGVQIASQKRC